MYFCGRRSIAFDGIFKDIPDPEWFKLDFTTHTALLNAALLKNIR